MSDEQIDDSETGSENEDKGAAHLLPIDPFSHHTGGAIIVLLAIPLLLIGATCFHIYSYYGALDVEEDPKYLITVHDHQRDISESTTDDVMLTLIMTVENEYANPSGVNGLKWADLTIKISTEGLYLTCTGWDGDASSPSACIIIQHGEEGYFWEPGEAITLNENGENICESECYMNILILSDYGVLLDSSLVVI